MWDKNWMLHKAKMLLCIKKFLTEIKLNRSVGRWQWGNIPGSRGKKDKIIRYQFRKSKQWVPEKEKQGEEITSKII